MANYLLKTVTSTYSKIVLNRKDVGFTRLITSGENAGKYIGRIGDEMVVAGSNSEAFHEICKVKNRIALCGSNDAELAREALQKRNARVAQQAAEEVAEMQKMLDVLKPVCSDSTLITEVFGGLMPRIKKRKVAI
jgi:hypothetical protein